MKVLKLMLLRMGFAIAVMLWAPAVIVGVLGITTPVMAGNLGNPPGPPPAYPPLKGTALLLGTLSLSLATFMNVLDSSIANVSIPAIAGDLGVSPG